MSRLRSGLTRVLSKSTEIQPTAIAPTVESLNKLIDFDLAIIEDAYHREYAARQERIKRLATIGEIAGGVAHELRNPLGIIRNAAYYLKVAQQSPDQDTIDAFDELSRGLANCNRLVSELLDYVREPKREQSAFPIVDILDEALTLSGVVIGSTIELMRPPAEAKEIICSADRGHVTQIVANLIRNAVEAMPEGGRLSLHARNVDRKVVLEVTDTGLGISATDLEKVFEPLFSRKTKGIGLGLAVSRRYAELNGGSLEVESELGQGTRFQLTLPPS